ncbi:MAG: hypothetical protein DCF17_20130 [Shackletoniella antarctica]|uniref:Uncharacterized protein n=1 Tax=Shackletoniella antarctica TaxID=268115 RepID=A0A2W4XFK3_9CYAN|nr:MAG: hypothetical protein DCF17_20130 [Shackletoniella antarctica]
MWIIYKADLDAPGWESRQLQPQGSFTSILAEQRWHDGDFPQVGDRVYESRRNGDEVEARDGDWIVSTVEPFTSPEGNKMVVCHCTYSPIAPQWEPVERLAPISQAVMA